jgi:uncharacterized membrane protein
VILGGMAGSIATIALAGPAVEGVLLAVIGALLGAFGGYMVRRDLVEKLGCQDWHVAVAEDLFTILGAWFALHIVTG